MRCRILVVIAAVIAAVMSALTTAQPASADALDPVQSGTAVTTVDPQLSAPRSLSCPAGHCYGLDQYDNFLESRSGRWHNHGAPEPGSVAASQAAGCVSKDRGCSNVSCPRPAFCAAVDDLGRPLIWSMGRWTVYKTLPPKGFDTFRDGRFVSCGSARFCVAVDPYSEYSVWNGRTWSVLHGLRGHPITKPSQVWAGKPGVTDLSCAGNACMMVNVRSVARKLVAGGHWSTGTTLVTSPHDLTYIYSDKVSCANLSATRTRLLCADTFVDENNTFLTLFTGGAWHPSDAKKMPFTEMGGVSCSARGRCIAVAKDGTTYEYGDPAAPNDSRGWTGPITLPGVGSGVVLATSCQAATTCTATISPNLASTYRFANRSWTTPRSILIPRLGLSAISCTIDSHARRFCLAGDIGPRLIDDIGNGWRPAVGKFRADQHTVSVSCVTGVRYCVAITDGGQSAADSAGTITVTSMPTDDYVSVACWATTGCYAVSTTSLYRWDGSTWSGPTPLAARGASTLADIACAAGNSSCLAVTRDGSSFRIDGTSTTVPATMGLPTGTHVTADACQSSTKCVAIVSGDGGLYSYTDGAGWTHEGDADKLLDVACAPSASTTHCLAVGSGQTLFDWDGTTLRYAGNGNKIYYDLDLPSATCVTTTTCYAVDPVGAVHTYS